MPIPAFAPVLSPPDAVSLGTEEVSLDPGTDVMVDVVELLPSVGVDADVDADVAVDPVDPAAVVEVAVDCDDDYGAHMLTTSLFPRFTVYLPHFQLWLG